MCFLLDATINHYFGDLTGFNRFVPRLLWIQRSISYSGSSGLRTLTISVLNLKAHFIFSQSLRFVDKCPPMDERLLALQLFVLRGFQVSTSAFLQIFWTTDKYPPSFNDPYILWWSLTHRAREFQVSNLTPYEIVISNSPHSLDRSNIWGSLQTIRRLRSFWMIEWPRSHFGVLGIQTLGISSFKPSKILSHVHASIKTHALSSRSDGCWSTSWWSNDNCLSSLPSFRSFLT